MARIGIVYWSMYGATHQLALAIAEGVAKDGGTAELRRVPDPLLPDEVRRKEGVADAIEAQEDIAEATVEELGEFDGLVIGSPTRFGSAAAQVQNLFDQAGPLWEQGTLSGMPVGFFTGASTTHGGHETTILSMATFAMHHGMVIVPAGYAVSDRVGATTTGGSPYGPSHRGDADLSDDEREIGLAFGAHLHAIAARLAA